MHSQFTSKEIIHHNLGGPSSNQLKGLKSKAKVFLRKKRSYQGTAGPALEVPVCWPALETDRQTREHTLLALLLSASALSAD